MCCCSANHKLFSICLPFIIFLQHKGYCNLLRRQCVYCLPCLPCCVPVFSVLCVCIYIIPIILSLFITPLAVAYNASLGGPSPLIGVFMFFLCYVFVLVVWSGVYVLSCLHNQAFGY